MILPIPIPMFMPSSGLCHGPSMYGVTSKLGDMQKDAKAHHTELLEKLDGLARDKLSVTCLGADILPFANRAFNRLDGPARDYDMRNARYQIRLTKIRARQLTRSMQAHNKREAERRAEKAAQLEAIARKAVEDAPWWCPKNFERELERVKKDDIISMGMGMYHTWMYEDFISQRDRRGTKTQPRKPAGYDDLPSIKEVIAAAELAPGGYLSIPIDTLRKLRQWGFDEPQAIGDEHG